ncbi:MAG: peptidase T, partial [Lachnospiraceae bacterium]|nr:peptidase T [Lachnospiraceae bacterium]
MSKVVDYFLKYASYDTQSAGDTKINPSTDKQFELAKYLKAQMEEIGLQDVSMSDRCYVYGTIPATVDTDCPTIGFLAHMDTSPDYPDDPTNPQIIKNYDGGDIKLGDTEFVLSPSMFPFMKDYIGQDLITADGHTLLGADDKAGIAEIMCMAEYLINHPEIPHGTIKVAFTPDEEIGHGVDNFDVEGFGADFAYTVDGGAWGSMEYETFNAASLRVFVHGQNIHPGSAKAKMKNSVQIAMEFDNMLPAFDRPQYTEMYEGFFHLNNMEGNVENTV